MLPATSDSTLLNPKIGDDSDEKEDRQNSEIASKNSVTGNDHFTPVSRIWKFPKKNGKIVILAFANFPFLCFFALINLSVENNKHVKHQSRCAA